MAALLKSVESKDFVGSNPTLSARPRPMASGASPRSTCRRACAARAGISRIVETAADRRSACASDPPATRGSPAIRRCPLCDARGSSRRRSGRRSLRTGACLTLDARPRPAILRATSRIAGDERDEYPSSVGRETRWLVETGATTAGNGPGSLRTERHAGDRDPSRLRRRAPAIQGSADREGTGHTGPSVTRVRQRRMRVAPRKARPFVPGRYGRFLILEATR